jgi:peptidoglycan/LPS O-acetylase OafA/YrhL
LTITHADYKATRHIAGLDGIRALCIIGVITFHAQGTLAGVIDGSLGVMAFFVLSGYLITTLCLREEEETGDVSLRAFYVRRVFRLVPLYYAVIAIYWMAACALHDAQMKSRLLQALPYFVFHINELAPVNVFGQSWSLGVEEKFYLLWPLLAFVVSKARPRLRILLAFLLMLVPLGIGALWGVPAKPFAQVIPTPREAFWDRALPGYAILMLGCLLACLLYTPVGFRIAHRIARPISSVAVVAILLLSEIVIAMHGTYVTQHSVGCKLAFAFVFTVFLTLMLVSQKRWLAFLEWRLISHIGQRSYALYLVHMLCLRAAQVICSRHTTTPELGQVGIIVVAGVLSLAAAEILYWVVEDPLRRYGKRFAASKRTCSGPVPIDFTTGVEVNLYTETEARY